MHLSAPINYLERLLLVLVVHVLMNTPAQGKLVLSGYGEASSRSMLASSVAWVASAPFPQPAVLSALGHLPGQSPSIMETIRPALERENLFSTGGKWPIVVPVPVRNVAGW